MLPITITEKKSEERTSERREGPFDLKKQSTSSQARPRPSKAGHFFEKKRSLNQIKQKKGNVLPRPVSSIDELVNYNRQVTELA